MLIQLKNQVKSKIKNILFDTFHKKKLFPGQMSSKDEILNLIEKLRPVKTQYELIRLGSAGDGGYLVPADLENIDVLISPGVGFKSNFELECAKKGMEVHLIDASVKGPMITHPNFRFHPLFLGMGKDEITLEQFILQNKIHEISGDWMLQMDIEGSEWETLIQLPSQLLNRFRILVIEFHHLDNLFNKPFFKLIKKIFEKLLATHEVVHLHPNNVFKSKEVLGIEIPRYMEFTFLRKDRIQTRIPVASFPHPLDSDCTGNPSYPLPKIWYALYTNVYRKKNVSSSSY